MPYEHQKHIDILNNSRAKLKSAFLNITESTNSFSGRLINLYNKIHSQKDIAVIQTHVLGFYTFDYSNSKISQAEKNAIDNLNAGIDLAVFSIVRSRAQMGQVCHDFLLSRHEKVATFSGNDDVLKMFSIQQKFSGAFEISLDQDSKDKSLVKNDALAIVIGTDVLSPMDKNKIQKILIGKQDAKDFEKALDLIEEKTASFFDSKNISILSDEEEQVLYMNFKTNLSQIQHNIEHKLSLAIDSITKTSEILQFAHS